MSSYRVHVVATSYSNTRRSSSHLAITTVVFLDENLLAVAKLDMKLFSHWWREKRHGWCFVVAGLACIIGRRSTFDAVFLFSDFSLLHQDRLLIYEIIYLLL